jgi:hypothetical protein
LLPALEKEKHKGCGSLPVPLLSTTQLLNQKLLSTNNNIT